VYIEGVFKSVFFISNKYLKGNTLPIEEFFKFLNYLLIRLLLLIYYKIVAYLIGLIKLIYPYNIYKGYSKLISFIRIV
jgi:hypothetical protein